MRLKNLKLFVFGWVSVLLVLGTDASDLVAAPFNQESGWSDPLNLSQSGAATEPRMVIDANDIVHVIWRDNGVGSFFYSKKDEGNWLEPISLELPFGSTRYDSGTTSDNATPLYDPRLFADKSGRIHAFWLGNENTLFYSSVLADQFGDFASWSERQQLATSAADFAVTLDGEDNIHLGYIRDIDSPEASAGIYYREMNGQNLTWSQAVPIYESAYYRGISSDNANVEIAATNIPITGTAAISNTFVVTNSTSITETLPDVDSNDTSVLIAGDNRLVERIIASNSIDSGDTWNEPFFVDERKANDSNLNTGPSQVKVVANGNEIHLTWLAGHETNCEQYHQWSADAGMTWQPPIVISSGRQGCPNDYQLLTGEKGLLFLLTFWGEGAYLQAWNGIEWSEPEFQPTLTTFVDPVTYRQVSLGCYQTAVTSDNKLIIVGCGSGTINDIWTLERPLSDETTWFPVQDGQVWSKPELIFDSSDKEIKSPIIISGTNGLLHAFWIGIDKSETNNINATIYYTQWSENSWSRVIPLMSLDTLNADELQGAFDENGTIILVWRNPEKGTYMVSEVNEQEVQIPAHWTEPKELVGSGIYATHPALYVDRSGAINIVFATPLNENRGIYWIRSDDSGLTWTDPALVFNAAKAGWQMVDHPHLTQTGNGDLHVTITRYELLQLEPKPESLYYLRSQDGGVTWSEPKLISEDNIGWSEVIGLDEYALLTIWQQIDKDVNRVFSQQSLDGGYTWEQPIAILSSSLNETSRPLILQEKATNQLHLFYSAINDLGELALDDLLWQGGNWQNPDEYILSNIPQHANVNDFATAKLPNGELTLIYNLDQNTDEASEANSSIYFTNRLDDFPSNTPIPLPETAFNPKTEMATPTIQSLQTPTPISPPSDNPAQLESVTIPASTSQSLIAKILVGIVPALIVIGCVLVLSEVRSRHGRKS